MKHGTEFRCNGIAFDPESVITMSESGRIVEGDCVEISAERVGLGPGVHLWVSCFGKDSKTQKIDSFQVFFPCVLGKDRNDSGLQWPGPEYTDLSMGDLARSLELIFFNRNPKFSAKSKSSLRLYGRWLSSVEMGRDIFRAVPQDEELYSENLDLFLDINS